MFLDETLYTGEPGALVPGPEDYAYAEKYRLPAVNTVMLGRLAKALGIAAEQIAEGIRLAMPDRIRAWNINAVREVML